MTDYTSNPLPTQNLEHASWSEDPFASDPFAPGSGHRRLPRPVVEIVQNLGGYRKPEPSSIVEIRLDSNPARLLTPEPADQSPKVSSAKRQKGDIKMDLGWSTHRFKVTSLDQLQTNFGSSTYSLKIPALNRSRPDNHANRNSIATGLPASSLESSRRNASRDGSGSSWFLANGVTPQEPPIDIREFGDSSSNHSQVQDHSPEPIPGAFQCDPDYFEHHATQRYLNSLPEPIADGASNAIPNPNTSEDSPNFKFNSLDELDRELAALILGCDSQVDVPTAPNHGDWPIQQRAENPIRPEARLTPSPDHGSAHADPESIGGDLAGVIYAGDRQVVFVDGKDGYEYIDLSCFDIKQASFQGNRIQVCHGKQTFEIDYRNVTHVLFANGQEVELANEEDIF